MDDDGASTSKGTGSKGNKSRDDDAEDDERDNMSREERQIFDAKFKELQVYMPMLKKFLNVYEQKRGQEHDLASEKQFHRFRSLYALFTSKKRCKLDTLYKCEEFFKKRFKVSECPNEVRPIVIRIIVARHIATRRILAARATDRFNKLKLS